MKKSLTLIGAAAANRFRCMLVTRRRRHTHGSAVHQDRPPSEPSEPSEPAEATAPGETLITITAGDVVMTGTLNDSQVAQDFTATLPVTLPWFRNAGTESVIV